MKLICTQENFKKAIFNTERVTSKNITLPILNNILLETGKGCLKIAATNLEVGVNLVIGAKVELEGSITIPSKLLSNFINNLPVGDNISIETDGTLLKIISGNYKAKIKGLDAQDFPIIPKPKGEFMLFLPAQALKEAASRALICVSPNETRPELTGINASFFADSVVLAATDSFRLVEETIYLNDKEKTEDYAAMITGRKAVIIPANTFSEILRMIGPEIEKVGVAVEEGQIFFEIGGVTIVSRLINGKYPEYKQIIPQKFNTRAVAKREDALRATKIASIFTGNKAGEISFEVDASKKGISIQSQDQETGENTAQIGADITGPNQSVLFNPRYVIDGISSIGSSQVAFLINNNSSPVVIKMIDEKSGEVLDQHTYVVMPIKN